MKRCDYARRLYQERIRYNRTKRKYRKSDKSKSVLIKAAANWDYIVRVPRILSIEADPFRHECMRFIKIFVDCCSKEGKRILIDFMNTDHMIADGALLFRAYLCRAVNAKHVTTKIRCRKSLNQKINEVLQQIGIFDQLDQNPKITPKHRDVINWRYAHGSGVIGEKYEDILGHYDGAITDALSSGLFVGLTEAMTNTRQHAYPVGVCEDRSSECNEWWMFSQEKDGRLSVVFCDLGVGIPGSLPSKRPVLWKKIVKKFGVTPSDSKVINEAIKYSQSRTEQKHRGKGLKQLTNVLTNTQGGILYVHSNHGSYNSNEGEVKTMDYKSTIGGTLISWSLPL